MMKLLMVAAGIALMSMPVVADNAKKANDFPTQGRVEYVLGCMSAYGGENYNNMYNCVCAVDKIAEEMNYEQYVSNATLSVMINTPGEKGGPFRDATGGRKAVRAFSQFITGIESSCGLKKKGS